MKKTIILLILFLAVLSFLFSSDPLTISGNVKLLSTKESGEYIKETILKTEEESVEAHFNSMTIVMKENTLLAVLEKNNTTTIYLVYGKASVKTETKEHLLIYTPVTLIEENTDINIFLISTDDEEKVYNYSSSPITGYDAIRGIYVSVEDFWDYFGNSRMGISVPDKPIFINAGENYSIPDKPIFLPVLSKTNTPNIVVTQTIVTVD